MLHHLALTASSLEASIAFYDRLLAELGYRRTMTYPNLAAWEGAEPEILVYRAAADQSANAHRTYDPGIHHVAFQAGSRAVVDRIGLMVPEAGGRILDAPRGYPDYAPNYYAVFVADPDGIKLEVMTLAAVANAGP